MQGQADAEEVKRDLGLTLVPPAPSSAHPAPLGPQRKTPDSEAGAVSGCQRWLRDPKMPHTTGIRRPALGDGGPGPRAAGGRRPVLGGAREHRARSSVGLGQRSPAEILGEKDNGTGVGVSELVPELGQKGAWI